MYVSDLRNVSVSVLDAGEENGKRIVNYDYKSDTVGGHGVLAILHPVSYIVYVDK